MAAQPGTQGVPLVHPPGNQVQRQEHDAPPQQRLPFQRRLGGFVQVGRIHVIRHDLRIDRPQRRHRRLDAARHRQHHRDETAPAARIGRHQPSRPQYQAVMRGSFNGVYEWMHPRNRSASRPAYSATSAG